MDDIQGVIPMPYVLWIDTETTGLDPETCSIIQASLIVEKDAEIVDELNIYIRPFKGAKVSKYALEKNGITIDELRSDPKFIEYPEAYKKITSFLGKYVNKYDKKDKFVIAGKNVRFDTDFLRSFFSRNDDGFYGSWFFYPTIEIESVVAEMVAFDDFRLPDFKLETICAYFQISIENLHNAYSDIHATRKLYWKLKGVEIE